MKIHEIMFYDIETVGCQSTYEDLCNTDERLGDLWKVWQDKYKETNGDMTLNEVFEKKAGLHAEYAKVVCASFGCFDANNEHKITSFYGHDEKDILLKIAKLLDRVKQSNMILGGHNIKKFDNIFLWKRMLIHGIKPPDIINTWNKKPWDVKFFDTSDVWGNGSFKDSFTSLDTITAVLGVPSPKDALKAAEVHDAYWNKNMIEDIKTYCEKDIRATMDLTTKIINMI